MCAQETFERVRESGVIGIVRTASEDEAHTQVERVIEAGLSVVEVSMTTPGALSVVKRVAGGSHGASVGAGTVLDEYAAQAAIDAGARIIVCPTFEPEVVRVAIANDVAVVPGCLTPTEMTQAIRLGATAVKIFPANTWSPAALSALLQALPHLPCVPTGSVGPDTAEEWIAAGAVAVGVGSALTAAEDPRPVVASLRAAVQRGRAQRE